MGGAGIKQGVKRSWAMDGDEDAEERLRPASLLFLLLNFLLFVLKRLPCLFLSLASPPSPILRKEGV
jgi:hypothetical protein